MLNVLIVVFVTVGVLATLALAGPPFLERTRSRRRVHHRLEELRRLRP